MKKFKKNKKLKQDVFNLFQEQSDSKVAIRCSKSDYTNGVDLYKQGCGTQIAFACLPREQRNIVEELMEEDYFFEEDY